MRYKGNMARRYAVKMKGSTHLMKDKCERFVRLNCTIHNLVDVRIRWFALLGRPLQLSLARPPDRLNMNTRRYDRDRSTCGGDGYISEWNHPLGRGQSQYRSFSALSHPMSSLTIRTVELINTCIV